MIMAREFKLCVHKDSTIIYELFMHDDGLMMEQEIYARGHIDEGMEVVDMLKDAGAYYRKIVADIYEVNRLPSSDLPLEFKIEMTRAGVLFRSYTWDKNNGFIHTVLESGIDLADFQENNRLNKLVNIAMRQWGFDRFELTRI